MKIYNSKEEAKIGKQIKDKKRYDEHRKERCLKQKLWSINNPEKRRLLTKKRYERIKKSPEMFEKMKLRQKRFRDNRRIQILTYYSNGKPKCKCCGESHIEFLAIDHIHNDGAKHRKEIGGNINIWLVKNNYPDGFQVLCHNCNFAKGVYKQCPHLVNSK